MVCAVLSCPSRITKGGVKNMELSFHRLVYLKLLIKKSKKRIMNFQCRPMLEPIKVFIINPLAPASQLIIMKIMSGVVFGNDQLIDLNLIEHPNEMKSANAFRLEIESCAFSCTNSIKVSSDLPSANDGDVFCFTTNFSNPNRLDFTQKEYNEQFDAFYLIIKLANSFKWSKDNIAKSETKRSVHFNEKEKSTKIDRDEKRKPIFMADGLVTLDILKSLSEDMPHDIFFCPTPITAISRSVLADHLNVQCKVINDVFVWAANDEVFHVEVQKPLIIQDVIKTESQCQIEMHGKGLLETRNLDTTEFSASWLKKEFIEKVASSASKNPYGCIYRAAEFTKTLRDIWITRTRNDSTKVYSNIGVISDGSLGTIKGFPYVLPIIMEKGAWSINKNFMEDIHLKQEIKRINDAVKKHHAQLKLFCKNFLRENIISQTYKEEDESNTTY